MQMDSARKSIYAPLLGAHEALSARPQNATTTASDQTIESQLTFDTLTGLHGMPLLAHGLRQSIRLAERDGDMIAVLCIGIDNLDTIGDASAADHLLCMAAQCLLLRISDEDMLGRLDSRSFMMALMGTQPTSDVMAYCQQLLEVLAPVLAAHGGATRASVGVALFPHDGTDSATLLSHARQAQAHASNQGQACQFYSPETRRMAQDRSDLEHALRQAIRNDELLLVYQPLADLRSGAVAGLEALLRWQHPQRGLLSAAEFLPHADAASLDAELADWVLQRACRDLRSWREVTPDTPKLTLNVSNTQFHNPAFPAHVAATLQQQGLTPQALALEITESALTQAGASCDAVLNTFQAHGLGLALDDFGSGHASLANLKRFPFEALKIDRSFIRNIATAAGDAAMCQTIIAMAHHLGMRAVAKGVETESQCALLRRSMCDMIQGYLFAEPLAAACVPELLRQQRRLPAHLLHAQQRQRRLLLVDDEPNIISSLKRLLRGEQYQIYTANSGQQGLDVLAQHAVDVIVSDQRMPGMLGVDFLRQARLLYPDTIRIMLSGYTELQSVTDAVNEGAIYKFLTKPWEDEFLRQHIADAFAVKEIADDNARLYLELQAANLELAAANRRMAQVLQEKQCQISSDTKP